MHVLWECSAANVHIWANGLSGVQKWKREGGDHFLLLWEKLMMGALEKVKLEEIAVQFRKVWLRRNTFVFEKRLTCPKKLLSIAIETLEDFKQANKRQRTEDQQVVNTVNKASWVRPVVEFVKVNWDASLDMKNRRMVMGMIIRDENGEALLAACDSRMNVQTTEVAECQALWKALQVCSELNIQKAIFE